MEKIKELFANKRFKNYMKLASLIISVIVGLFFAYAAGYLFYALGMSIYHTIPSAVMMTTFNAKIMGWGLFAICAYGTLTVIEEAFASIGRLLIAVIKIRGQ